MTEIKELSCMSCVHCFSEKEAISPLVCFGLGCLKIIQMPVGVLLLPMSSIIVDSQMTVGSCHANINRVAVADIYLRRYSELALVAGPVAY
jgi:hypothetical protein